MINWLNQRRWNNILGRAVVTVGIIGFTSGLLLLGYTAIANDWLAPEHVTKNCYQIKIEGAWFSDINICDITLPNGVQCYTIEFGDGGGLYCE